MKSVISQVQREFRVSAAEIESHDKWQMGVIGLACVSTDPGHADSVLAKAVDFIGRRAEEAQLLDYQTESIHVW